MTDLPPVIKAFLAEYEASTEQHPAAYSAVRIYSDGRGHNALVQVYYFDGAVHVGYISSLETQGAGSGRAVLKFLCQLADKHSVALTLVPRPVKRNNKRILTTAQLVEWYGRYGFVREPRGGLRREPMGDVRLLWSKA